jgi:MFS family permease
MPRLASGFSRPAKIESSSLRGTFRSLDSFNYRIWAAGALISNVGSCMQYSALNWLVLTQLTQGSAATIGIMTGLEFGPQVLLLPWTGFAVDRFDRRKLLFATGGVIGILALALCVLTVTELIRLWHVYAFALLLGCAAAFDLPARQTFVAELVEESNLSNAVALNAASFSAAQMIGPAVAGLLFAAVGPGWVFVINAASFGVLLGLLSLLRADQLHRSPRAVLTRGRLC